MLSDTSPEAERVWIDLWRRATPSQRLGRALAVSSWVMDVSRQALRRRKPELSDREIDLWWVELHYGRDLARNLRAYLEQHGPSER